MKKADPFYLTSKWKAKRGKILRRDGYQCQECKRYGRGTEADTVHHVYSRIEHPRLAYESWNLISLCTKCHNTMHDRDNDNMTDKGKEWQERKRREYEKRIPPSENVEYSTTGNREWE
ncbi:MAG: HNH endonuclease [Lachnospiraceae bacterium]